MTLTKRITELMNALSQSIPEREFCIQLAFLVTLVGEPFYLYGRSGSGKSLVINRLVAAYKNARVACYGKRNEELPETLGKNDMIVFQSYNPLNEKSKSNVNIAFENRAKASLIISGDLRPEVALNRGDIADKITLTVSLPDAISSSALCSLLKAQSDVTSTHVPLGLMVTAEEKNAWNEEIRKITLSEDTLYIVAEIARVCDENNIYVSIHKWIALTNIVKAIAFFNGRTETRLTDTFFLGTAIWGRSTSNKIITDFYKETILKQMLKGIPNILEKPFNADDLLTRINKLKSSSNNLYETKLFNDEECVSYHIKIAGETIPLYVPLRYIETEGDFHPFNELRNEEYRVKCNFHGTSMCSISIDVAVKGVGIRNSNSRTPQPMLIGKFDDYGTLPTHILKENDPDIIEKKKQEIESTRKEIQEAAENETKNLQTLKEVFSSIKSSKEDLFCNKEILKRVQDQMNELFENSKIIIGKIKEAHVLLSSLTKVGE